MFSKPTVLIKSTVGGSLFRSEKARVSGEMRRRGSGKHGLFNLIEFMPNSIPGPQPKGEWYVYLVNLNINS